MSLAGAAGLLTASFVAIRRSEGDPSSSAADAALLRPDELQPEVLMRVVDLQNDPVAVSNRFLTALVERQYGVLWSMLAPAEQAAWSSPDQYAAFLNAKFGRRVLGYTLAAPEKRTTWINPDTRDVGQDVHLVPHTLTFDSIPVSGYPLALVSGNGMLQVLTPGPASRRGPILKPESVGKATRVPILMYHHVADSPVNSMVVPLKQFGEELAYLQQKRYNSITMTDLMNALYYGMPLPDRPIIISFDDGYGDAYVGAFPLLKKYGFIGTFALISNVIGYTKEGYLSADQVREMAAAGMEIVSHTQHHTDLGKATDDQVINELRASRNTLSDIIGWPVQHLVYPYGAPFARGTAADQTRIKKLLLQEGYASAATTVAGSIQDPTAPYELHRITVSGAETLSRFASPLPY